MFNLKSHNTTDDTDLIKLELQVFRVVRRGAGYSVDIGDEIVDCQSLADAQGLITQGADELRKHCWESWKQLTDLSERIVKEKGKNSGGINNLLFLNAARRSFFLSRLFTDLDFTTSALRNLIDSDIAEANDHLIAHFNSEYLQIKSLHKLIMSEQYRLQLIQRYMSMTKQAAVTKQAISGPWANVDLPEDERKWDASQDTLFFENRRKSRQESNRYNPEYTAAGYYMNWQDHNRDPYLFEDMKTDSPYPSRHSLLIN